MVVDAKTPAMRQWHAMKAQAPDAFLFFRLGDFYELFYDDALIGAPLLGLTLTARNRELAERYATPLPKLIEEVEMLAARVDEHLKKMGASWK